MGSVRPAWLFLSELRVVALLKPRSQKRDTGHPYKLNSDVGHPPAGQYIGLLGIAFSITALYDAQHPAGVRALSDAIECAYEFLASETNAWVAVGLAGNGDSGTITRTGRCSVKANINCSAQDVQRCQTLYPNCKGNQCGNCLSYCLTQCEWPYHKPECDKWKFPKDWKDFPPPPIRIN